MAWGELDHYFGVNSDQLRSQTLASPEAPVPTRMAGQASTGEIGTYASFTDWKRSPVFWLAVFALLALAMIHAEAAVAVRLRS